MNCCEDDDGSIICESVGSTYMDEAAWLPQDVCSISASQYLSQCSNTVFILVVNECVFGYVHTFAQTSVVNTALLYVDGVHVCDSIRANVCRQGQ